MLPAVRLARSLLNPDRLIDDEATVCTNPFVPRYAKPCVRLGSVSVPTVARVDDEFWNVACPVVEE